MKHIPSLITMLVFLTACCDRQAGGDRYALEHSAKVITQYVHSIVGVGSWDLVPNSVDGLYLSSKQGSYFTDKDRSAIFSWESKSASVRILDDQGRPVQVTKDGKKFEIRGVGSDGTLGTADDVVYVVLNSVDVVPKP